MKLIIPSHFKLARLISAINMAIFCVITRCIAMFRYLGEIQDCCVLIHRICHCFAQILIFKDGLPTFTAMMNKSIKGFTLIELMVALVVLSILTSVGVPSFSKMIKNSRQSATYNALISDLSFARSEAVKRSNVVVVCARNTDTSCQASNDWNDGQS